MIASTFFIGGASWGRHSCLPKNPLIAAIDFPFFKAGKNARPTFSVYRPAK
jgi:hypothetical protein